MKFTSFAYGGEKYIVILPRFFLERLHMDNLIVYIMFYCDIQVHMHSYVPTLYNLEGNAHWIHSSSHFLSQRIWYCFPQQSGEQGRVPVLLLKLNDTTPKRKPVIVFLHSSYKCKEWLRPLLEVNISLFVALEKKKPLTEFCHNALDHHYIVHAYLFWIWRFPVCRHMPPEATFLLPSILAITVKGPTITALT